MGCTLLLLVPLALPFCHFSPHLFCHLRTKSGRALSSSCRNKKKQPSPWGFGRLPWTDLCAESGSRVVWEQQSPPKITCGSMTLFPGMRRGRCPFPNWGWTAGFWGGLVLKRKVGFLDNVFGLFCGSVPFLCPAWGYSWSEGL